MGERLFSDVHLSSSPFNVFACSTCHQVSGPNPPSDRIDPGYDLFNVVHRPSWWGGYETRLLDAINYCLAEFMGGGSLAAEDPPARELYEYFAENSPDNPAPALPLTVIKNVTALEGFSGEATSGRDLYQHSCQRCHGQPHTGSGRLSSRVSVIPEDTLALFPTKGREVIVEKVRHGKFFNIGGIMPLYSAEAISDQQIADVLSYLGL